MYKLEFLLKKIIFSGEMKLSRDAIAPRDIIFYMIRFNLQERKS